MITAKLNGGIGNKMFQIAATYSLALDNDDICGFYFGDYVAKQGQPASEYRNNILKKVREIPYNWIEGNHYKEQSASYHPIPYSKNMILEGYFQSEKYFESHKQEVINLFKDEDSLDYLKDKYDFKDSLSIHVRRGDYLEESLCHSLPVDYYNRALFAMDNNLKINNIYVFSDDMEWCFSNFEDDRIRFMDLPDYQCLYAMSLYNHNIIANSTFSWWGAYLNENPGKIIIAPYQWGKELGSQDIYTKEMIII